MPAQPLSAEQKADAARLKAIYASTKRELGITQESLAAACGWESQGTVSQYLNGKIPLNLDAALKFSRELRCEVAEFSPGLAGALSSAGGTAPDPRPAPPPSPSVSDEAHALARESAHIAALWLALPVDQRAAAFADIEARAKGEVPASMTLRTLEQRKNSTTAVDGLRTIGGRTLPPKNTVQARKRKPGP